ncbi:cell division protein FtsI [Mycobacterium haemophilum]|uniref:Penicillin-binding protein PbpB n=2 Tax=Mycobacterium haemophilum TaxID=29311 RepID=A0A0I9TQL6_9MYCO|nr:cell division protein FtsI [Mycobacterium haemophilum]KLO36420.1 cell division protein FtsI [Mycobacterium haemophilum]KLO42305.1 cell division protein FtsI [Mycobacterium haemophilum]KLO50106.1 cell division protein FtsI [Mycobacterium haemophilum]
MRRGDAHRTSSSRSTRPGRSSSKPPVRQPKRPRQSAKVVMPDTASAGRSARERRTRQVVEVGTRGASFIFRHRAGNVVIFALMLVAATQLFILQVSNAAGLRAQAAGQLKVTDVEKAVRGSITDRNNEQLAFTIESRALTFQPKRIRQQLEEAKKKTPSAPDPQQRLQDIAKEVAGRLNNKPDGPTLLKKLHSNDNFVYLARAVDPAIAEAISAKYPEVGSERQDLRQYPGGSLAANIVGGIDWDGHGLLGLEDSLDSVLSGTDGSVTYDRGSDGVVIPGSYRNRHRAVNGSTVQLTIDDDIQFYVQQQVQQAKNLSGAHNVSAVVLDAKTGEVLAMANDNTFDPSQDIGRQGDKQLGNLAVSSPFEPGSVNKVIAAASVIEYGLSNPDEVLQVPGSIQMGGVTVHDAWEHGVMPYTTTGVFGKSSNVGTLMLAQRVGPERFYDMVRKFGLGQRTGVGLPGESAGLVPPIDQWSGSTFSNLPIGQGLSMTLLQMTGMYQAIANDGVRMPPRIIKATIAADGTRTHEPRPDGIRVVSPQTAQTVRQMLRAVVQHDPMGYQQGTGSAAGVSGYQIAGKTGTAQQINPACGCYFDDVYWITFAGMATADNPRYVIGIMMDNPQHAADGSPGTSAAPLFHNIAGWLMQRENVPLSPDPGPPLRLQAT